MQFKETVASRLSREVAIFACKILVQCYDRDREVFFDWSAPKNGRVSDYMVNPIKVLSV